MSVTQVDQGMSIIRLENIEAKSYEWNFQVPPRSLLTSSIINASTYDFNGLKFTSGFLSKIEHHWDFQIYKSTPHCSLQFFIHQSDLNFGITIGESELQLLNGGERKGKVNFGLKPVATTDTEYKFIWENNSIPTQDWDDSVDMLKIILNFQFQKAVECVTFPSLGEDLGFGLPADDSELKMGKYFLSESLSDVTLVSGEVEFPAHRVVLSSCSPVFQCMFQHEMKESTEGRVVIEDVEPKVLKEMLNFIYTGGVSNSIWEDDNFCVELFKSADKYGMKDFRVKLSNRILRMITCENAVEMSILGDMHNEPQLFYRGLDIIKKDRSKALRNHITVQDLTKRCPKLAYELMTL